MELSTLQLLHICSSLRWPSFSLRMSGLRNSAVVSALNLALNTSVFSHIKSSWVELHTNDARVSHTSLLSFRVQPCQALIWDDQSARAAVSHSRSFWARVSATTTVIAQPQHGTLFVRSSAWDGAPFVVHHVHAGYVCRDAGLAAEAAGKLHNGAPPTRTARHHRHATHSSWYSERFERMHGIYAPILLHSLFHSLGFQTYLTAAPIEAVRLDGITTVLLKASKLCRCRSTLASWTCMPCIHASWETAQGHHSWANKFREYRDCCSGVLRGWWKTDAL